MRKLLMLIFDCIWKKRKQKKEEGRGRKTKPFITSRSRVFPFWSSCKSRNKQSWWFEGGRFICNVDRVQQSIPEMRFSLAMFV